jgi:parvulin-like peptidyl-prolyl isomerase
LPVGIWLGPIQSRFGAHLVRVESRMPGMHPPLAEVRHQVLRDFDMKRRQRALEAGLAAMRRKYEIVVEPAVARQASR